VSVLCIYAPTNASVRDLACFYGAMTLYMQELRTIGLPIVLAGDLNAYLPVFPPYRVHENSDPGVELETFMALHRLVCPDNPEEHTYLSNPYSKIDYFLVDEDII